MSLLTGVLILLLFQCLGEVIKAFFSLNIPGPVIGMVLLFITLCLRAKVPGAVIKTSQTLIPLLALMFLPAAAGLFFLGREFKDQWGAVLAAVVVGSILSLIFNGLMMKWLLRADKHSTD